MPHQSCTLLLLHTFLLLLQILILLEIFLFFLRHEQLYAMKLMQLVFNRWAELYFLVPRVHMLNYRPSDVIWVKLCSFVFLKEIFKKLAIHNKSTTLAPKNHHWVTILGVTFAFIFSLCVSNQILEHTLVRNLNTNLLCLYKLLDNFDSTHAHNKNIDSIFYASELPCNSSHVDKPSFKLPILCLFRENSDWITIKIESMTMKRYHIECKKIFPKFGAIFYH